MEFSDKSDQDFDEKISSGLLTQCENLTNIKAIDLNHQFSLYLKNHDINIAGILYYIYGTTLWCDSIYVEEPYRNQGFGKQIITKLFDIARDQGLFEIQLNTYFLNSYIFFIKCGFHEVAKIPNWKYGLTCYLMKKTI